MTDILPPIIAEAIEQYSPQNKNEFCKTRNLVFEVSRENETIGPITETLKWGEPAYLTEKTKSGSTLRIGQTRVDERVAIFVNCRTKLIDQVKQHYGDTLEFDGTRAIIFDQVTAENSDCLKHCISLVLTYHLRK